MKAEDFLSAPSAEDFLTGADGSGEMTIPIKRRRGTEKARYVAPDNPDNPIAPASGLVAESIRMPAPTFDEERKGRAAVDALIARAPAPVPRGPRPQRDIKAVAQDLYSILGNTGVQLVKPFVDIPNMLTGGALDGASQFLSNAGQAANLAASPTTNYDRQTLANMPEGASLDKVGQLLTNPGLAANMAIPSAASMVLPLTAAKGMTALFPRAAAALGPEFQTATAVGANALMNAGDTFGQTESSTAGRLLAALGSGVSSALVGKATGGGLEGQLARGGKIPTVGAALKGVGNESLQEFGENVGNSLAQDTGQGNPLNFAKALDEGAIGAVLAPFVSGPVNLAGVATSPERANARLLSDAINGFDASVLFPNPVDNAVRQPGPRFDPVAAAAANMQPPAPPAPAIPQLGYDPAVQNQIPAVAVDSQGNARPMSAEEFLAADTQRQEQQDMGLTPDVQRAIAARKVSKVEPAEPLPSDLVERLRATGWTPPQQVFDQKPNLPQDEQTQVDQANAADLEKLYQQDVKDGIKQRLGLEQPPAPEPAAPKPVSYAESPFLREIAARGGVNLGERNDTSVDPNRQTSTGRVMPNPYNIAGKPLFRPDGLRGDALVESLVSQGYISQAQVDEADAGGVGGSDQLAYDLIRKELENPGSVRPINQQDDAAAQVLQQRASSELDSKARSIGLDTKGLSDDEINLALKRIERRLARSKGRADVSREVKAEREAMDDVADNPNFDDSDIPWDNAPSNMSTEDAMRALGFTEQEIADATAVRPQGQGQSGEAVRQAAPNDSAGPQGPAPADARGEGGQRPRAIAAEQPAGYAAEQQPDDFSLTSGPYEEDLFGNSTSQQPARNNRPAQPASTGVRRDVQPTAGLQDTPAPPGDYYVNTIVGTEVQRELGASRITSPQQAAQATQYLYRSAVERMDGIVTDKNGTPLAVIGGFKGALAQTSVYPGTLAAEAVRIPGAAYVWFSHNHPSGTANLSRADENLNRVLSDTFRGSGIEPRGLLAVAGDKFAYVNEHSAGMLVDEAIPPSQTNITVPAIERQLAMEPPAARTVLADPIAAKSEARAFYAKAGGPGIMLLDSQNRVVAWIPISHEMKGPLRGTGQLNVVWRAVSQANAGSAIIVHGGELDEKGRLPGGYDPSSNIAAALQKIGVRALDSINVKTGVSVAQTTGTVAVGPVYSKASASNKGAGTSTPDTIRAALRERFGDLIPKMEARGFLKIWPSTQAFNDGQTSEHLEGPVQGYWDGKQAHLFADGIAPGNEVAVLLHEVGEHASMEDMLGPNQYERLVSRAHDLVDQGDPTAVRAMDRIPDDTPRQFVDSELLAYMIETVAADGAKAAPGARKWLADTVAAIRAWFAQTGFNKMLDRYGKGLQLTPADIAALAVRAVRWQAEQGRGRMAGGRASKAQDQTGTPEFKAWFGDSKVVDADGKPLVVYHGTAQEMVGGAFNRDMAKSEGGAFYFSHSPLMKNPATNANDYARNRSGDSPNVVPVYLRMENPLITGFTEPMPEGDSAIAAWLGRMDDFNRGLDRNKERYYKQAIREARSNGHDGVIIRNVEDVANDAGRRFTDEADVYIAFDPEQIKSAIGNRGTFDAKNPDIRYSRPAQSTAAQQAANVFGGGNVAPPITGNPQGPSAAAAMPWSVAEPGRLDDLIRRLQDSRIDIRRTVDAIKATGAQIADDANPYLMDELYIGKVRAQIDRLADDHVTPLLRAISNAGFTPAQVNDYLWARHAEERNRQMAKVNNVPFTPALDLAGMSTTDANAKLAAARALPNFAQMQAIARMVDAITSDARTRIVTDGLEDASVIQAWEGAYKHYVPLQRDVEESGGKASGYNVRGPEARRAVGSSKEAVNILANVIAQAEATIIRAEKAAVGRSVLDMARQNPNPDFWTVDTPPTERAIDPRTGLVTTRVKPNYKALDNVFVVKEAGVEHFVTFNEKNPRAVQFARSLKNMDAADLGPVMKTISAATRYLAQWVTSRNPLFWMTNFARDVQGVAFNLQSTPLKGQAPQVMAKIPQALAGVASNKLKGSGKWATLAQEFADAGGQTGYLDNYRDSVERMGEIEKDIARMQQGKADPRRVARAVLDVIDGANDVIENGVRLAVYAQAREEGISQAQAASIAKNISVNFNRKGNDTAAYNALYMFFNANVQGNVRMIQGVMSSRRAQVYAGALTLAGAAVALLNWQLGGDDEESRKKRYQLVPEWERERNWIVFIPGTDSYVKIPLPLGPHILFNAGRVLSEMGIEKDADPMEKAASFASSLIGAFNPIGGGLPSADAKGVAQVATPTVLRPVTDLVVNQNFAGTPIAKEKTPFGYNKPAYGNGRESTPSYWTTAAKAMNDWTGGDSIKPGAINLSPEQLAYLVKGYVMPGITQTADKMAGQAMSRKDTPVDQIVGVSKFFGKIDENERSRAAFDTARKDREKAGQYTAYLKAGERQKANELLTQWGNGDPAVGRKLLSQAQTFEKLMAGINKERRSVQALPEDARDERLNRLDERMQRTQAVYLRNRAALIDGADE